MHKTVTFIIVFAIIITLFSLVSSAASASSPADGQQVQETNYGAINLPKIKVLPDQFWYFFEVIKEKIVNFFTFDKVQKAQRYLDQSSKRLAEIKLLLDLNKNDEAKALIDDYYEKVNKADSLVKEKLAPEKMEVILEMSKETFSEHQKILDESFGDAPAGIKNGLYHIIRQGKSQTEALRQQFHEKLMEVDSQVIESRLKFLEKEVEF